MHKWIASTVDTTNISETGFARTFTTLSGNDKTIGLEREEWDALDEISRREQSSLQAIFEAVDLLKKPGATIDSALRLFIFDYFRMAATEEGHKKAGHGMDLHAFSGNHHVCH